MAVLKPLTAYQRAHYADRRFLYRPTEALDDLGDPLSATYELVAGEQSTPGRLGTTDQFDQPNSRVGQNNRDNLQTADAWFEQSNRDTRPGDVMRIVQAGSDEVLWYVIRGAAKNRPSRQSRVSNWQAFFLAITPKPAGISV